jgi:hypothetical protein
MWITIDSVASEHRLDAEKFADYSKEHFKEFGITVSEELEVVIEVDAAERLVKDFSEKFPEFCNTVAT